MEMEDKYSDALIGHRDRSVSLKAPFLVTACMKLCLTTSQRAERGKGRWHAFDHKIAPFAGKFQCEHRVSGLR